MIRYSYIHVVCKFKVVSTFGSPHFNVLFNWVVDVNFLHIFAYGEGLLNQHFLKKRVMMMLYFLG
jgi:hypothetical protein